MKRIELQRCKEIVAVLFVRPERFREGHCVQMLTTAIAEEPATVAIIDAFAAERGYRMAGKHHEVFMGDLLHRLGFDERIRGDHHIFTQAGVEKNPEPPTEGGKGQTVSMD